jgi:release factor glutamine methyltransferase
MKSVVEILDLSARFLASQKIERPRRSAEDLLAHVLQCKRLDLYLQYDRPLLEKELLSMRELVKRCASQEPIDYLIGEVDFFGCALAIDRRVLIPRQETEALVERIVKKLSFLPSLEGKVLWDLCTGSGCIGIALKKRYPSLKVSLSDQSRPALEVALQNSRRNGVEVELCEGDLLEPFKGRKADFIVCNPPYVTAAEYIDLPVAVKDFEPKMALVGGERGTEIYERLEKEVKHFLHPGASLFFEIGSTQGNELKKIFSSPFWSSQEIHLDGSGRDRFFFLEMQ